MCKARIAAAAFGCAAALVVAACARTPAPAAVSAQPVQAATTAAQVTDPNGLVCAGLDSLGYCSGDDVATDPSGTTCAAPLPDSGYCPGDEPSTAPALTMAKQDDTIVFRVSGSAHPSILYGTDSSDHQAPGGYGPLGDGSALPWKASMPYDPGALYYAVTAQLEGGGSITDSVTEVVETWCSDGTRKTESFPLANGSASGGYAIARAQYDGLGSDTGNAQQAESDAGC